MKQGEYICMYVSFHMPEQRFTLLREGDNNVI